MNKNRELNKKHNLLSQKYRKLKKRMVDEEHDVIRKCRFISHRSNIVYVAKPPPVVVDWMSNTIQQIKKCQKNPIPTPVQCQTIISEAAAKLGVASEQLQCCQRNSAQQTARRLTFLVWPNSTTRGRIDAKTICRDKLQLIHGE